jgi:aminocarboxymuconate-semialdehyde decarboxylase
MDHFEPGRARVMLGTTPFRTVTEQCWNPERRLADVQAEGSQNAQIVSPMPELLSYWFAPPDTLTLARHINEQLAELVHTAPQHFFGLGMVPLQEPNLAARELESIKDLGLRGVELGSNISGASPGDARFADFFAEMARLDLCVFVHALHPTMTDRLPNHAMLVNAIGFATEMGLAAASVVASGLLERLPNLRIAFSQSGGGFASMLPRWQFIWNSGSLRQVMPRAPIDYARMLYYDTLQTDVRTINYLIDTVGAAQLAIATDYPFVPPERPLGNVVRQAELDPEQWLDVSHRNCLRFIGKGDNGACSRS